jgi:hypothetical protein
MNPSPKPMTIRIGYQWSDRHDKSHDDELANRYDFIREQIQSVEKEVVNRLGKRKGTFDLCVRVGRMRALHGAEVLPRLRELCQTTDILVFDITDKNPNVMLELGMALTAKAQTPGHVFIFCKKTSEDLCAVPSDLRGCFITFFKENSAKKKTFELVLKDSPGFRAALRTRIIEIARERGMWAERGLVDDDQD